MEISRIVRISITIAKLVLVACVFAFGLSGGAHAWQDRAYDTALETYRLADRKNLKHLSNGDFLFRIAREKDSGITFWAYMGSTRHIFFAAPRR